MLDQTSFLKLIPYRRKSSETDKPDKRKTRPTTSDSELEAIEPGDHGRRTKKKKHSTQHHISELIKKTQAASREIIIAITRLTGDRRLAFNKVEQDRVQLNLTDINNRIQLLVLYTQEYQYTT